MRVRLAAAGAASAATAWERYADPALWATWSPQIASVVASSPRLAAGTTGVVRGHGGLALDFVVDAVDDAQRSWVWRVVPRRAAGLQLPALARRLGTLRLAHAVFEDGAGCSTALVVEGAAPVVVAYAPLAAVALRLLVRSAPVRPVQGSRGA